MTADAVIADWVPWSTGETVRYRTKLAAAAALRRALDEEGYVIVPRVATANMCMAQGNPSYPTREIWNAMVKESQR